MRAMGTEPPLRGTVWTKRRQWIGNLLPLMVGLPPLLLAGFLLWNRKDWGGPIALACLGPVLTWLAMNFWGLFENARMKREMETRWKTAHRPDPIRRYFVGMATPAHSGMLDPHEDVGWLAVYPEKLEFFGDRFRTIVEREKVDQVSWRPNAHSLVFLGGFCAVEGAGFRICFEMRDHKSLWRNRAHTKRLLSRLQKWLQGQETEKAPKP